MTRRSAPLMQLESTRSIRYSGISPDQPNAKSTTRLEPRLLCADCRPPPPFQPRPARPPERKERGAGGSQETLKRTGERKERGRMRALPDAFFSWTIWEAHSMLGRRKQTKKTGMNKIQKDLRGKWAVKTISPGGRNVSTGTPRRAPGRRRTPPAVSRYILWISPWAKRRPASYTGSGSGSVSAWAA
jgi:hypothetical protein